MHALTHSRVQPTTQQQVKLPASQAVSQPAHAPAMKPAMQPASRQNSKQTNQTVSQPASQVLGHGRGHAAGDTTWVEQRFRLLSIFNVLMQAFSKHLYEYSLSQRVSCPLAETAAFSKALQQHRWSQDKYIKLHLSKEVRLFVSQTVRLLPLLLCGKLRMLLSSSFRI